MFVALHLTSQVPCGRIAADRTSYSHCLHKMDDKIFCLMRRTSTLCRAALKSGSIHKPFRQISGRGRGGGLALAALLIWTLTHPCSFIYRYLDNESHPQTYRDDCLTELPRMACTADLKTTDGYIYKYHPQIYFMSLGTSRTCLHPSFYFRLRLRVSR